MTNLSKDQLLMALDTLRPEEMMKKLANDFNFVCQTSTGYLVGGAGGEMKNFQDPEKAFEAFMSFCAKESSRNKDDKIL